MLLLLLLLQNVATLPSIQIFPRRPFIFVPPQSKVISHISHPMVNAPPLTNINAPLVVNPMVNAHHRFTTALEQKLAKQERKERRRGKARSGREADADWVVVHGFRTLVSAELQAAEQTDTGRVIVDGLEFKVDADALQGPKALPKGTTRR